MLCLPFLAILLLSAGNFPSTKQFLQQKTITIQVDEKGEVRIDRVRIQRARLANELEQRLWRGYVSNSIMATNILFIIDGPSTPELQQEFREAIKMGQERTLAVLSLHKYRKRFEDIGTSKQERLKKQFPVLFQEVEPV